MRQASLCFRLTFEHPALDDATLVKVEADLLVPEHGLAAGHLRNGAAHSLLMIERLPCVEVLRVIGIDRVLHNLDPVAVQDLHDDLLDEVIADQEVPTGKERHRIGAEIGEHQAAQRLNGIGDVAHLVLEIALRRLGRLIEAPPALVPEPPVINTAEAMLFGDAVFEADPPVGTCLTDKAQRAALVPVEHEILAQDSHGLGRLLVQLGRGGNRQPIAPQQGAHPRARRYFDQCPVLPNAQHVCLLRPALLNGPSQSETVGKRFPQFPWRISSFSSSEKAGCSASSATSRYFIRPPGSSWG
jgi:hypothetical protein